MRIYALIVIKKLRMEGGWNEVLTANNWYDGELTPTIYDPQTLQPAKPSYIVKCNDGKFRKVDGDPLIAVIYY